MWQKGRWLREDAESSAVALVVSYGCEPLETEPVWVVVEAWMLGMQEMHVDVRLGASVSVSILQSGS
mgnify:CR=1 FL=1